MALDHTDFFDIVDGVENPEALICCDFDKKDSIILTDETKAEARRRDLISANRGYEVSRHIHQYETALRIERGRLSALLDVYREMIGKQCLSVADFGCGTRGYALSEILAMKFVQRESSLGITINSQQAWEHPSGAEDRMMVVSALNIAPKRILAGLRRFDVLFSVCGTITYHPLNKDNQFYEAVSSAACQDQAAKMFGLLQAVHFLKEGGLLCGFTDHFPYHRETVSIAKLLNLGILKLPEFAQFKREYAQDSPKVFIINRHPSWEEIRELLGIGDDNFYRILE